MQFPSIDPTKIGIELPDYIGSVQEFQSNDYITKATQYVGLGVKLNLEWNPLTQEPKDDLKTFYDWCQRCQRFSLPSVIINQMPSSVIAALIALKANWWIIDSDWTMAPVFVNNYCSLYSVNLVIKSV